MSRFDLAWRKNETCVTLAALRLRVLPSPTRVHFRSTHAWTGLPVANLAMHAELMRPIVFALIFRAGLIEARMRVSVRRAVTWRVAAHLLDLHLRCGRAAQRPGPQSPLMHCFRFLALKCRTGIMEGGTSAGGVASDEERIFTRRWPPESTR